MKKYINYIIENTNIQNKTSDIKDDRIEQIRKRFQKELIDAVIHERYSLVLEILEEGIDINFKNDKGYYLFSIACNRGSKYLVDILFEYNPIRESITEAICNLSFMRYEFSNYNLFHKMIFYILSKTDNFDMVKTKHVNYFPFYFNGKDMLIFKDKYPERYDEYLRLKKANEFNI